MEGECEQGFECEVFVMEFSRDVRVVTVSVMFSTYAAQDRGGGGFIEEADATDVGFCSVCVVGGRVS